MFRHIELKEKEQEHELTLYADDDFKLSQVKDVPLNTMAKRQVDVRLLDEKS
jgi:cyclic-di-GMP-binding protein